MACLRSDGDFHKRGGEGKANKRRREKEGYPQQKTKNLSDTSSR